MEIKEVDYKNRTHERINLISSIFMSMDDNILSFSYSLGVYSTLSVK